MGKIRTVYVEPFFTVIWNADHHVIGQKYPRFRLIQKLNKHVIKRPTLFKIKRYFHIRSVETDPLSVTFGRSFNAICQAIFARFVGIIRFIGERIGKIEGRMRKKGFFSHLTHHFSALKSSRFYFRNVFYGDGFTENWRGCVRFSAVHCVANFVLFGRRSQIYWGGILGIGQFNFDVI